MVLFSTVSGGISLAVGSPSALEKSLGNTRQSSEKLLTGTRNGNTWIPFCLLQSLLELNLTFNSIHNTPSPTPPAPEKLKVEAPLLPAQTGTALPRLLRSTPPPSSHFISLSLLLSVIFLVFGHNGGKQ